MNCIKLFFISMLFSNITGYSNPIEGRDFVPDSTTAIKIAEAIWLPIYGEKIYDEKPFKAYLVNDSVWIVKSSLHGYANGVKIYRDTTIDGTLHVLFGGVLHAEIRKSDGRVSNVYHSK